MCQRARTGTVMDSFEQVRSDTPLSSPPQLSLLAEFVLERVIFSENSFIFIEVNQLWLITTIIIWEFFVEIFFLCLRWELIWRKERLERQLK